MKNYFDVCVRDCREKRENRAYFGMGLSLHKQNRLQAYIETRKILEEVSYRFVSVEQLLDSRTSEITHSS